MSDKPPRHTDPSIALSAAAGAGSESRARPEAQRTPGPRAESRKESRSAPRSESELTSSKAPNAGHRRVFIQAIEPEIDAGAYPAKRILGDVVTVSVDLVADGQDVLAGELLVRAPRQGAPAHASGAPVLAADGLVESRYPLLPLVNDRYAARFTVTTLGRHQYTIEAWVDPFAGWRRGFERKLEAGTDIDVDVLIGAELLAAAAARATGEDRTALEAAARELGDTSVPADVRGRSALEPKLFRLASAHPDRSRATRHEVWLPLWVDRPRARFSSWYELFPRSTGPKGQHGTFKTVMAKLPYVAAMGFDVLYLPPIHPIGNTFRKGKNNSPSASESDVGSPWAIGSAEGGHKSVHPELGTLAEFEELVREAAGHGLEVALDIALQVTPDHPYVKEHPEWFRRRPDGSIQYAENPPKKYQDIYPFDFESDAWWSLWLELKSIFDFWIERGVRIFRVDNPHTKSLAFWQWCISELTKAHPDLIFLAEAFTRPKLMYMLAKLGFTQSYSYFTWRNTAQEMTEYLRELTSPPVSEFFRPNFWPNTPDILPEHLQHAGRAAFNLRLVLAATLCSNYGVYGPAFELMDNVPRAGVEEYVDNEKYELKTWDLNRSDSLRPLITRVNAIRQQNSALWQNSLLFHKADNELLLCFSKHSPDGKNSVLVVINMDAHNAQAGWVNVDFKKARAEPQGMGAARPEPDAAEVQEELQLHDQLSDARYFSQGRRLFVRLDPASAPAHIFRLRHRARTEHDFDYFV
jgi:starch synthase (maltosyl-transferring)